jgi:hypothetical protein
VRVCYERITHHVCVCADGPSCPRRPKPKPKISHLPPGCQVQVPLCHGRWRWRRGGGGGWLVVSAKAAALLATSSVKPTHNPPPAVYCGCSCSGG